MIPLNLHKLTQFLLFLVIVLYLIRWACHRKVNLAPYRKNGWFGRNNRTKDSPEITPTTISLSSESLDDLHHRLLSARFIDHLPGTSFTNGFSSTYLKYIVGYWATKYDWRKEEATLNTYPHYLTTIEGLEVHFVRFRGEDHVSTKATLPLLLIHSCLPPGSFAQFTKSLPYLTVPDEMGLAFEVIVPSIPGFGLSESPHRGGFNVTAAARVLVKLMGRLGFKEFFVHGDWFVGRTMAILYPDNVLAVHLLGNYDALQILDSPYLTLKTLALSYLPNIFLGWENRELEYGKLFPLKETLSGIFSKSGALHLAATSPDTLACGLVDSPVALVAYLLEPFTFSTKEGSEVQDNRVRDNGGLTDRLTLDELLTSVMLYWSSGNIAGSVRFLRESFSSSGWSELLFAKVKVPSGTLDLPGDYLRTPKKMAARNYANLVSYSSLSEGGHFLAMEDPVKLTTHLRDFIREVLFQVIEVPKVGAGSGVRQMNMSTRSEERYSSGSKIKSDL